MKSAYRLLIVASILIGLALPLAAQNLPTAPETERLRKLGLSDEEIRKVTELTERSQKTIREARLDIEIFKAQTEKLLLDENPDMNKIEQLLRQALEKELAVRMTEIKREIELRKILGDRKWALMRETARKKLEDLRTNKLPPLSEERLREMREKLQKNLQQLKKPSL